jgi:hypothetical protein
VVKVFQIGKEVISVEEIEAVQEKSWKFFESGMHWRLEEN